MSGYFISLEGGEGAGKSTALSYVEDWLSTQGIEYILTREPGGTPLAEEIRSLVLAPREEQVDVHAELLLVFAARLQHVRQKILPALAEGKWVISDRFVDSSYIYQGIGRNIDAEIIDQLVEVFLQGAMPDATILLDVPVEIGLSRVASRGDMNRLDGESVAFHEKVRNGFLELANKDPERVQVVDASQALGDVKASIQNVLNRLYEKKAKS